MRGKIVVVGLGVATIGVLLLGYWLFFAKSPIDQRFNLNRTVIPKNFNTDYLLPDAVGDFVRQSISKAQAQSDGTLSGVATYADTDGKKIVLLIRTGQLRNTPAETLQMQYQPLQSEYPGAAPVLRTDAPFPYGYFSATQNKDSSAGSALIDFRWINGEWLIQASTQETDAESLLQFVNLYPY